MYARVVCDVWPQKQNPNHVHITSDGDCINYPCECSILTKNPTTVKLLLNQTIFTYGSWFLTLHVKTFYLKTPLKRYKYLNFPLKDIPKDSIEQYNLNNKAAKDKNVFVKVQKGMYSLPQSSLLVQKFREERLAENEYHKSHFTLGLWKHELRQIQFTLVVNNFNIK